MTHLFKIADDAISIHGKKKTFKYFKNKLDAITELKSFNDVLKKRAYKAVLMYILTKNKNSHEEIRVI